MPGAVASALRQKFAFVSAAPALAGFAAWSAAASVGRYASGKVSSSSVRVPFSSFVKVTAPTSSDAT